MALGKTEGTLLTLSDLNEIISALQACDTRAKLLRALSANLSKTTSLPVSAFAYGQNGHNEVTDEHLLPAKLRGKIPYPKRPMPGQAVSAFEAWGKSTGVQIASKELNPEGITPRPLSHNENCNGGMVIWGNPPTDSEQQALTGLLVREASIVLHNLDLRHEIKSNIGETMVLQKITQAITRSLDFDKIADTLLTNAKKNFHVDAAALYLLQPDKEFVYISKAVGLSDDYVENSQLNLNEPTLKRALSKQKPDQLMNARDTVHPDIAARLTTEGLNSILIAPIYSGNDLVGALTLYTKAARRFSDTEMRFAQSLSEQAGIAFANAHLHSNLQKISNEIEQTRNLMRDGLLVFDREQRLRYFNAAAASFLNLTEKSLMRTYKPGELVSEAGLVEETADEGFEAALKGKSGRCTYVSEGEAPTYYEAIFSPYRDAKGNLVGILVNIRDITNMYIEKEKLETIQHNISDGILMVDTKGLALEYNEEWRHLFDISEAFFGQPYFEHLSKREDFVCDLDPAEAITEVLKGKRITCYIHHVPRKMHLQLSLSPIRSSRHVRGAVATARDITPLIDKTVEANEMAAKAQHHLRELTQLAELSGIVGFNVANIFQKYLSKTANLLESNSVSIYLYDPVEQELVRRQANNPDAGDLQQLPLGSKHVAAKAFVGRRAVASSPNQSLHQLAIPISHRAKNLGVILVGRPNAPYGEHEGKLLRLVATRLAVLVENSTLYHDVNARRERWEAVFRFTEEGIIIFDNKGTIVGFNPAATEITQFASAEAVGKSFTSIVKTVGPESSGANSTALEHVLGQGLTLAKSEQIIESRSGNRIWTEISYSPIFDDASRVTSGIAIIRNTTKDHEVEEIKSDFISIVSHELRTPLTAIKGFLSMTLKSDFGPLSEKQYHYLSRVYQSNQRMIDLVEDLMDATHIESGKINLSIAPVAMETIIAEVVSELAGKGAASQVLLNVRRRQRLPLVLADETRLHQILINLIDNAIKYSMPGTEVEVDFKVQGDELITTISDHGVGISKNQLDRLFTKFGRIFNPLSVQAGGTGLGLYIVKNLVESHGGRIWVTSLEEVGSKFNFSLPIAKQLPLLV